MPPRSPKLRNQYARTLLYALFGSSAWQVTLIGVIILVTVNWFSQEILTLLAHVVDGWIISLISIVSFVGVVIVIILLAKNVKKKIYPSAKQYENPEKVKALIIFLSPPGKEKPNIENWLKEGKLQNGFENKEIRKMFKFSWRMIVESIAYHLPVLKKVVVIASCDTPGKQEPLSPRDKGTFRNLPLLSELINQMAGNDNHLQMISLSDIDPALYENGVDFESMEDLIYAVDLTYEWLLNENISPNDILIDVTGGQKVPTIAGAVVTMTEDKQFQYVSTRDYKVKTYDIIYKYTD